MREIVSAPLRLEPQTAAHAAEMFVVLGDPAIHEFENAPPASLEWLRERFTRLESRRSADGREQWLNWVVRLPTGVLAGYVQATVHADGSAAIAYELASAHWGQGVARRATQAMLGELVERYRVRQLRAVLKRRNLRSLHLLERLGFVPAPAQVLAAHPVDADERLMWRRS